MSRKLPKLDTSCSTSRVTLLRRRIVKHKNGNHHSTVSSNVFKCKKIVDLLLFHLVSPFLLLLSFVFLARLDSETRTIYQFSFLKKNNSSYSAFLQPRDEWINENVKSKSNFIKRYRWKELKPAIFHFVKRCSYRFELAFQRDWRQKNAFTEVAHSSEIIKIPCCQNALKGFQPSRILKILIAKQPATAMFHIPLPVGFGWRVCNGGLAYFSCCFI